MYKTLSILSLLLFATTSANAADHAVSVGGSGLTFSPSSLMINKGDTVTFHNAGGFHNVASDTGLFRNGSASSSGWTYTTPAFNEIGTFGYHCEIHGAAGGVGMAGAITVQDYGPPPPPPPNFGLAAQSSSPSLAQGGSVADTITITPANGFSDNVTFSASGLPNGVSASFAAGGAATSVLTLTASATAATGTANITVTGTSGSLSHSLPLSLTVTAAAPAFAIGPGITGSWYLPAQSGHGFNVEVLKGPNQDNGFLAFWYVYDNSGNNLWLVGQGSYVGDTATLQMQQGSGGMFPPNFDKNKIARINWGTLTLKFTDCNNATAQWDPIIPAYPSGSMNLVRLSAVSNLACP